VVPVVVVVVELVTVVVTVSVVVTVVDVTVKDAKGAPPVTDTEYGLELGTASDFTKKYPIRLPDPSMLHTNVASWMLTGKVTKVPEQSVGTAAYPVPVMITCCVGGPEVGLNTKVGAP
jgi:hypothetical protein